MRVWNPIVSGPLVAPARYIGIGQASARLVTGERSALDRNQSHQARYALTMWANAISQDQLWWDESEFSWCCRIRDTA
jgi:hypothetical protein